MGLLLEDKFVDSTMLPAVPITHFAVVAGSSFNIISSFSKVTRPKLLIFIMMSHEKACSAQACEFILTAIACYCLIQ